MSATEEGSTPRHHFEYYFEDGNITFLVENDLYRVHRYFFVRESAVFRDMLSIPSGTKKPTEGLSDDKPIMLQDIKSIDFECMLWMFYNKSYTDHAASGEKWSSIVSLAHMWQFETMSHAAFKAYLALPDIKPADKIAMRQKYDFPQEDLMKVYVQICTRHEPPSVEDGQKIGFETLALIGQTREEIKELGQHNLEDTITNNLIELRPSRYYRLIRVGAGLSLRF